jgi:short subunit dehydrogenase-like uncharacterized protein
MSRAEALLVYGATGYTGRLVAEHAVTRGLRPILAGRNAARLAPLGARLGCETRVARLDDPAALTAALDGVDVVLHAAGPFAATAMPVVDACLRTGAHYLDLSGEVDVYERLAHLHDAARERGIAVMPGVGFDVVASDALAVHVARRVAGVARLRIGLSGFAGVSRGSARTLAAHAGRDVVIRRGGRLVAVPPGSLEHAFDFGAGPRACVNVGWGDVVTAWYSTGAPDVETYVEATPAVRGLLAGSRAFGLLLRSSPWQALAQAAADVLPEGPTPSERAAARMTVVAEATGTGGRTARARLGTPDAYTFSAEAAAAVAARAAAGDVEPGFQTAARVYGPDFVLELSGVVREDLP